jgi:protein SCO1
MSPAVRRGFVVFVLAFLFLGGALAFDYWWAGDSGTAPTGIKVGGPFTLIDQNGVVRYDTDFRGKLLIVYFGYSFCPDACPTTLLAISKALDDLGPAADQVQPLFITVDPARDTPQELKLYGSNFSPRILMLTGSPQAADAAAKAYRVYYAKVPQEGGGKNDYLMDHTSFVYVMGRDGRFLTDFPPGFTPEQLAASIRRFS